VVVRALGGDVRFTFVAAAWTELMGICAFALEDGRTSDTKPLGDEAHSIIPTDTGSGR